MKPLSLAACLALCFALPFAPTARAACPVYDEVARRRADADKAREAYLKLPLPPDLQEKIDKINVFETAAEALVGDEPTAVVILELLKPKLDAADQARLEPYLQAQAAAAQAEAAAAEAERAYFDAFVKKDAALAEARKLFDADRAFLRAEKAELAKVGRGSAAFAERAAKLAERLRANYALELAAVAPFKDCFPDARAFAKEVEDRLTNLKAFEAKLTPPPATDPAVAVGPGDPPPAVGEDGQPLGLTYVLRGGGPEVKVRLDSRKFLLTSGPDGGSWRVVADDGRTGVASIKIDRPPPKTVRVGQAFTVSMTASGQDPAHASGTWYADHLGGAPPAGTVHDPYAVTFDGYKPPVPGGSRERGVWSGRFLGPPDPYSKNYGPPTVWAEIGRPVGNAVLDPGISIVWTYELAK